MSNWDTQLGGFIETIGWVSPDSYAYPNYSVTVSSADTKSAYTEIIASTSHDWRGFYVMHGYCDDQQRWMYDIAVGASSSEVDIAKNLFLAIDDNEYANYPNFYECPLHVPAGTRISLRAQSEASSGGMRIVIFGRVHGFDMQAPMCSKMEALGVDTSTTSGVQIDPGTTINTKGSWYEIEASVDFDVKAICLGYVMPDFASSNANWYVDVAVGGSGSEQIILQDCFFRTRDAYNEVSNPNATGLIPVHIPAGSRISMRAQSSVSDGNRYFDGIIYAYG